METNIVKFKQWECHVMLFSYGDNNTPALELVEVGTGEPVCVPSINLGIDNIAIGAIPSDALEKGYCYISEKDGMDGVIDCLEKAGIIERTNTVVNYGNFNNTATLVKVLIKQ